MSVEQEDVGNDNLVMFAVKQLAEHSNYPEVQLQEILSLIVEENRWEDFKTAKLQELFLCLSRTFEKVNEKLTKMEHNAERYQSELTSVKVGETDRREELNRERFKHKQLQIENISLKEQMSNMNEKHVLIEKLEDQNENLL